MRGGSAFVVGVQQAPFLQYRNNLVDESVDSILIDVHRYPETIHCPRLEPFLHVVRRNGRRAYGGGVVVDDSVRQDVADGPTFPCSLMRMFARLQERKLSHYERLLSDAKVFLDARTTREVASPYRPGQIKKKPRAGCHL